MAQFDVYKNPNNRTLKFFPYILDIQHSAISELKTRMVLPIGRFEYFRNETLNSLTPVVEYESEKLVILTPQIANMPTSLLGKPIGTLEHMHQDIINALDFAITGIP